MSSLPINVIDDTTLKSSKIFEHVEHTLEPVREEIDNESPRRSKRPRTTKSFSDDFTVYLMNNTPKIIFEAFSFSDEDDCKEAVRSKMDSILSNETWELVDRLYGCKPMSYKWCSRRSLGLMVLLISTR
jgi:hypothetical protein